MLIVEPQRNRMPTRTSTRPPPCPTSAHCPYRAATFISFHYRFRLSNFIRIGSRNHPIRSAKFIELLSQGINPMHSESQKSLVNKYVELWDTGNLALADQVLAANFVNHAHPEFSPGPASVKQAVTDFRAAFPDAHVTVEQMICEGDTV